MASLTPSLLIFASFLLLAKSTLADEELLDVVCHQSKDYEFCMQALRSDPGAAGAHYVLELSHIALDLAIQNTSVSRAYFLELIEKSEEHVKKPLRECYSWYGSAIRWLLRAYTLLEYEPDTANYSVMVASDSSRYCEKDMKDAKVSIASVSERNDLLMSFCDVGILLTDLLRKSSPPKASPPHHLPMP